MKSRLKFIFTTIIVTLLTASILTLILTQIPNPLKNQIKKELSQTSVEQNTLPEPKSQRVLQDNGRLQGQVLDKLGNPLKAQISLYRAKTGTIIQNSETDQGGQFEIPKIPPGDYYFRARNTEVISEFLPLHIFPAKTTTQNVYLDWQPSIESDKEE